MKDTKIIRSIPRSKLLQIVAISFVLGITWFVAMRVILYKSDSVHFHANFGLYINGEQELFAEPVFYEEVSSCGAEANSPLTRVHMHDMIFDVAHVHDSSATWGNFFENLGMTLGDNVLYSRTATYVDGQDSKLMFMLNGEQVRNIAGKLIESEDKLIISFDDSADVLDQQYADLSSSAAQYNETADPSSCSGSADEGLFDRLKIILGL